MGLAGGAQAGSAPRLVFASAALPLLYHSFLLFLATFLRVLYDFARQRHQQCALIGLGTCRVGGLAAAATFSRFCLGRTPILSCD